MLMLSRGEVSGQRRGLGKKDGSLTVGWTDRLSSVLLGSRMKAVVEQRLDGLFRWWDLAPQIRRPVLRRTRSDRGQSWSRLWIWWRSFAVRRICLHLGQAVRRRTLTAWCGVAWLRCGVIGARRRRERLPGSIAHCWGKGCLGWASFLGPHRCCNVFSFCGLCCFSLDCCCLFSVVTWLKISPPSVERGFGCFRIASMPLLWCHGRFGLGDCPYSYELGFWSVGLVGWLGFSQDFNIHIGGQSNGEKLPHMVWRFWVMVLEVVAVFLSLAAGMCVVSWGSLDVVPLIWRYSRGLFGLLSMFSCCQRDCHLFLHVICLVWDTVLLVNRWLFVMLDAGSYRDSRKWSHFVARGEGVWWLEFGSFGLMVSVTAVSWGFSGVVRDSSFIRPVDEDGVAACHTRTL